MGIIQGTLYKDLGKQKRIQHMFLLYINNMCLKNQNINDPESLLFELWSFHRDVWQARLEKASHEGSDKTTEKVKNNSGKPVLPNYVIVSRSLL